MKVLVADDSNNIRNHLKAILESEGFEVITAENGQQALDLYEANQPDFLCLDVMMPDISGFDICKSIRSKDTLTPIIFISSKVDYVDKVVGLEFGADDYIEKPFQVKEVIARIQAVARRCGNQKQSQTDEAPSSFTMLDLEVFPSQLRAKRNDDVFELTKRDLKILELLNKYKNQVVHRDMLLDECWGKHIMPESRTVDWHIAKLRKLIETDPKDPKIIKTVHGVGYRFED
jgi:DNA-binding response OmpR family regulator